MTADGERPWMGMGQYQDGMDGEGVDSAVAYALV